MNQSMPPASFLAPADPYRSSRPEPSDSPVLSVLRVLRRRARWILAAALVLAVLALIAGLLVPSTYRSSSTMVVEPGSSTSPSLEGMFKLQQSLLTKESVLLQVEMAKSEDVALRTVDALKLTTNPEFGRPSLMNRLLEALRLRTRKPMSDEARRIAVAREVLSRVSVEPVKQSNVIEVTAEAGDPKLAADLANAMVSSYLESTDERRRAAAMGLGGSLGAQLRSLRDRVNESGAALQAYRDRTGLVDDGKGSAQPGGLGRRLDETQRALVDARSRLAAAQDSLRRVRDRPDSSNVVRGNPAVVTARENVTRMEDNLAEIAGRYGQAHPQYQTAQADLRSAQRLVQNQVSAVIDSLERDVADARAQVAQLESSATRSMDEWRSINRDGIVLSGLQQEYQLAQEQYQAVLARTRDAQVAADVQYPPARLVDPAREPLERSSPLPLLWAAGAAFAGILLASLVVLLGERMRSTVRTGEDVSARLGLDWLASVPFVPDLPLTAKARRATLSPGSLYWEGIRTLASSVGLVSMDEMHRRVVFVSALEAEGKSTIATDYAFESARTNRVVLIECDLRRPTLSRQIGLAADTPGLSDCIDGSRPLEQCIHRVAEGGNLWVIPAGTACSEPLKILRSRRFHELLRTLEREYDQTVMDTPPIHLVSDGMALMRLADHVVMVVKSDATHRKVVQNVLRRLHRINAQVLGVVLSQHDFQTADRYFGEESGYRRYGYESAY